MTTLCAVMRCQRQGTTVRDLQARESEWNHPLEVLLCEQHAAALDRPDTDWRWDNDARRVLVDPEDLSGDHVRILADDSRAVEQHFQFAMSSAPHLGYKVSMNVRRFGSADVDQLDLLLSLEQIASWGGFLQQIARAAGHEQAGPEMLDE